MNKLSNERRAVIAGMLCEGNSVRAAARMSGAAFNTVLKLALDLGEACERYQREALVNLKCRRVECDELWSYVGCKEKRATYEQKLAGFGDAWVWVALDPETKLIPTWLVGDRGPGCATEFVRDLAGRLANRVQLTTDGHVVYLEAVEDAFGSEIDFAQLIKLYGESTEAQKRYSPAECIGTRKRRIAGKPDMSRVSTSIVERQNLTVRMSSRRFTRLTNAFSKKFRNHAAAVALHFMHYNFARIHGSIRITPAMEAGVSDHVWSMAEIVALLDRQA